MELKAGDIIFSKDSGKEFKVASIGKKSFAAMDENGIHYQYSYKNFDKYFCNVFGSLNANFTTEPPKTERYFIVFYENTMVAKTRGIYSFTTNGEYPNRKETEGILIGKRITNIIELNQQDYESWNK